LNTLEDIPKEFRKHEKRCDAKENESKSDLFFLALVVMMLENEGALNILADFSGKNEPSEKTQEKPLDSKRQAPT
jgi:hypothetical protein